MKTTNSMTEIPMPKGFRTFITNLGIKDTNDDFVCIVSDVPCVATGVFTQSRFAGPSVTISRHHLADSQAQAIVVICELPTLP
jgi:glutamate N-acetyltransferase/amino-acid N-acetyltransferase